VFILEGKERKLCSSANFYIPHILIVSRLVVSEIHEPICCANLHMNAFRAKHIEEWIRVWNWLRNGLSLARQKDQKLQQFAIHTPFLRMAL
jgi:hypothetical protein